MDEHTDRDPPAPGEPASLSGAMTEAVLTSVDHPHRFEAVFEQYHRAIHEYLARSAGPHRADELAGDVFVVAFSARARYDPTRGSVRAWLFGIAANVRRTRTRSERRGRHAWSRVTPERDLEPGGFEVVEDELDYGRRLAWVATFLRELPDVERDALVLYAWGGLTYAEVAQALGAEIGTIRSRLARARGRLRELIAASGQVQGESAAPHGDEDPWTSSSG